MTKVTEELKTAVEAYFLAKAYASTIRPVVNGYKTEILQRERFTIDREWYGPNLRDTVITDPKDAWKMNGSDFDDRYIPMCHDQHIAHGFGDVVYELGVCPLLVAEHDQVKAENAILKEASIILSRDLLAIYDLEKRQEAIDLTVKWVLSECPDIAKDSVLEPVN